MEQIIGNVLVLREIIKNLSLEEIIKLRGVSSGFKNAIDNHLASQTVLGFYPTKLKIQPRDRLKLGVTMNMSPEMALYNCISLNTLGLRPGQKLKNILSLFPNLEELYFFKSLSSKEVIILLEALKASIPNIKKLMLQVSDCAINSFDNDRLQNKQLHKAHLEDLLKGFPCLNTISLHGGSNQSNRLFLMGSQNFDSFQNLDNFSKLSLIYSSPPVSNDITKVLDIFINDYPIKNKPEDIKNLRSGLKALKDFMIPVSSIKLL